MFNQMRLATRLGFCFLVALAAPAVPWALAQAQVLSAGAAWAVAGVAAILSMLIAASVTADITRAVKAAGEAARRLTEGDFRESTEASVTPSTELGALHAAQHALLEKLSA